MDLECHHNTNFRRCRLWWRSIFWWPRLLSITIAHMKWWQSLSVIRTHYWWWTLNVTTTSILSATPPLVTFNFCWWRLFWPSPMSLWWHFLPLTNVMFSSSSPPTGACGLTESTDFGWYIYTSWEGIKIEEEIGYWYYSLLVLDKVLISLCLLHSQS